MIYLGLANVIFLLRYVSTSTKGVHLQNYYFITLFILFLFSAFRFQVGCDWSGYYYQYLIAVKIDWSILSSIREPFWWAILSWIQNSNLPYPFVNIVSSVIFFIGVHVLARRQPDPLGFLVLLFPILIINMPMSAVRQGAAIGLICIAFAAFIDRRPIWFTLWVILAAGFHASALIFLLLLPVATGHYTKSRLLMAAIIAIPGAIILSGAESANIASSRYIGTGVEAYGAVFRVGFLFVSSIYFFLFIRKKWLYSFPNDYSVVSIGAIGMIISFLLIAVSSVIGDRFGYYLIPIQAIIFARIPYLPFKSNQAIHSALPYLGLLLIFFVWMQISSHFQECYIPYNSWLFGLPSGGMLR